MLGDSVSRLGAGALIALMRGAAFLHMPSGLGCGTHGSS